MKDNMQSMRHEMSMVHHVKDEMEDLRDAVDKIEDQCRRRKNHLLQQANILYGSCSQRIHPLEHSSHDMNIYSLNLSSSQYSFDSMKEGLLGHVEYSPTAALAQ